jgi:hypothetical protein
VAYWQRTAAATRWTRGRGPPFIGTHARGQNGLSGEPGARARWGAPQRAASGTLVLQARRTGLGKHGWVSWKLG